MKLTLAEPRYLKDSIAVISELVNEVRLSVDKDKVEIIAMDPANVAMVIFKLLSSAFVEYNIKENMTIAVNLDSLKNVLRRAKPSDTVTLELDEERNRLKVELKGETKRSFNLGLIDIEEREQKVPELDFPMSIEMNTIVFDEAIEDMDIISDSVSLLTEKDKFMISSAGNVNDASVLINKDKDTSIILEGGAVKSKYSIEYMKKIIKGSKLSDRVKLQFAKDYPLRVEYSVKDKLQLVTILAPRVQSD